jgi:hypothetical protein
MPIFAPLGSLRFRGTSTRPQTPPGATSHAAGEALLAPALPLAPCGPASNDCGGKRGWPVAVGARSATRTNPPRAPSATARRPKPRARLPRDMRAPVPCPSFAERAGAETPPCSHRTYVKGTGRPIPGCETGHTAGRGTTGGRRNAANSRTRMSASSAAVAGARRVQRAGDREPRRSRSSPCRCRGGGAARPALSRSPKKQEGYCYGQCHGRTQDRTALLRAVERTRAGRDSGSVRTACCGLHRRGVAGAGAVRGARGHRRGAPRHPGGLRRPDDHPGGDCRASGPGAHQAPHARARGSQRPPGRVSNLCRLPPADGEIVEVRFFWDHADALKAAGLED